MTPKRKFGLGLDAQKAAVADRLNGGRWQIVEEFAEVRVILGQF